jgi:hypothetical protein
MRDATGSASVEVVVMLPVFIVLFGAVYYAYGRAVAEHEALSAARGCAFQYAMNGCLPVSRGPDLCANARGEKLARVDGDEFTGVFSTLENVPLVGGAVETLFGEGARGTASRVSQGFMGGEPERHEGELYLVCNTRSRSLFGHVKDSFCDLARSVTDMGGGDADRKTIHIPGCGA